MKHFLAATLLLLVSSLANAASTAVAPEPRSSLFFSSADLPAIRARAESTEWLQRTRQRVIRQADDLLSTPTAPYPLKSDENGLATAGRAIQVRVGTLAFAGYLTGDARYSAKARDILLAVVRQTEPDNTKQWLGHLQLADAAQGLAMGYDWVGPQLSAVEKAEVLDEVRRFGAALYDFNTTWGMPAPGVMSCNHNAVHFGALGLCALVVGDRPDWLAKATEQVRGYLQTFTDPTGYATEGHGYSSYGLAGAVPFAYALHRSGGPDLLAEQPAMALVGDQVLWKLLPFEGRMVATNDNFDRAAGSASMAGALLHGNSDQLWAWLRSAETADGKDYEPDSLSSAYFTPFLFLLGNTPVPAVSPAQAGTPLGRRFVSGRVFLRSSWTGENAGHVSFTSGYDFHRSHNHQDENSVTFAALGEVFITDPQNPPSASDCHTTLSVNGAEQIKGGAGRIIACREDPHGAFTRGQAEEAYDFTVAPVGCADRKVYFVRGPIPYLVWRDDMQIEDSQIHGQTGHFVARYITEPKNRLEPDGSGLIIHGARHGTRARLLVFSGANPVEVREDQLAGKPFGKRNTPYHNFLRRASASVQARNPRFVTLVLPFADEKDQPKVSVSDNAKRDEITCELAFPDGRVDRLTFSFTNVTLERK